MMLYKSTALEFKAGAKEGTFEGYAAVYGNLDDGYDVIEAGAFTEIRKKKNGKLRITIRHDTNLTVGEADVESDSEGLRLVNGQLNMKISDAADTYHRMVDGSFDALSVGFRILAGGIEYLESGARLIKAAELWETTICAFGMNRQALLTSVKSAGGCADQALDMQQLITAGFTEKDAREISTKGFTQSAGVYIPAPSSLSVAQLSELKSYIQSNPNQF